MKKDVEINLFWFRRDLRFTDNKALFHALEPGKPIMLLFVFDDDILDPLPANDHRVTFIYDTLSAMHKKVAGQGGGLEVRRGKPMEVLHELIHTYRIRSVFCNADHEPYGIHRDEEVKKLLDSKGVGFYQYLDHLIMEKSEVVKPDGTPYQVFTPYSKRWKDNLEEKHLKQYHCTELLKDAVFVTDSHFPEMDDIALERSSLSAPALRLDEMLIRNYHRQRDIPSINGTSRLGVHLRFGTLSIRELVGKGLQWNDTYLNELIWREFYAMILWHYPDVVTKSFKSAYDRIRWRNNEKEFEAWKHGMTGFPMVDAGMRQLSNTGYMHNRLRMVTASFLSKHLLIDWRWGEAWFAEKLFDYELSSNNGGWQWSAGTGCDAAPYFRIFNPVAQQKKFDPEGKYITRWVPEIHEMDYPPPIVDHALARDRCLKVYKEALQNE
ncbi:MAG: deoxyribodipyrimidine photo-lyase [Bacteroidia bacterium]|nr:MAG: deoxyribodipyrimidine photo-lyase [Bacteroidia bacterium]